MAPGDPPVVTIGCPSPGARLAPGTGLDFVVSATHDDGVERIELLVDDDPTVVDTVFAETASFRWDAPVDGVEGDVHMLHFRARSLGGVYGEATYPAEVIAANVVSADTTIAAGDTSLDGTSVVVDAGTLTIDGAHTFRDLIVLNDAVVTHSPTTETTEQRLGLSLSRDLFVSCAAAVDVSGRGYPGGVTYGGGLTGDPYVADDFDDGDLAGWQTVDDALSGSSNWFVSDGVLKETSNIYTSGNPWRGTFALWSQPLPSDDYRISLLLRSGDDDAVGVMFRYVDANNYYRFSWNRQSSLRRLEKITDGVSTDLASDGVRYSSGTWYLVQIVADGSNLQLWVDGERVFSVQDATYPSGGVALYSFGNSDSRFDDVQIEPVTERSLFAGGSHGGRGGGADGFNRVYGSLFDPDDPGSGGTGLGAAAGGGVVRIAAVGEAIIDGSVRAAGEASSVQHPSSAGGSIRLDATTIRGVGSIDASGGDGTSLPAAGGGGRIALYGVTISDALLGRTLAAGGDGDTPEQRGAAGTIFVKRDSQALGDLILDNGGLDTAQPTELLSAGPGVIDALDAASITDDQASFLHDLTGLEVFFNGDRSALWPITGHAHRGQTLSLETSSQPLTATVGDSYEGLYRFDRVIVRGGAEAVTRSAVESPAPEVESGSSWTEEHLPALAITSPTEGQTLTAGDLVTITASPDDLFGVESVRFDLDDKSFVDSSAPFEWTVRLSPVSSLTSLVVTASALDASGYALSDQVSFNVQPDPDGSPPVLTRAPCPRDGDLVLGGLPLSFETTAQDDSLLYRQTLSVDGVVVDRVKQIDQVTYQQSVSWTPPASAAPGTSFVVQIEVEDYGGNVATESLVLRAAPATALAGDQSLTAGIDGTDVVLGPGRFTVVEPLSPASLTLLNGAILVPGGGSTVALEVAAGIDVQCGAAVDVTGHGYDGGNDVHEDGLSPSWVSASQQDEGGSHGGLGGGGYYQATHDPGEIFDSVYAPTLGGGGGGRSNTDRWGGSGGGVVEIEAGSVVLDGEIRSRGEDTPGLFAGAGAGGTVVIDAGSLQGMGTIDASGGDYFIALLGGWGPPGGGGRVALYVDDLSQFDVGSQVSTKGGHRYDSGGGVEATAGPGTIYTSDQSSVFGRLLLDGGNAELLDPTNLPELGAGSVMVLEAAGADGWLTGDAVFLPRHLGSWIVLLDEVGTDLGGFRVVDVDGSGRALLSGGGGVSGAAAYRGEYRFDQIATKGGASLESSDSLYGTSVLYEGLVGAPTTLSAQAVTLASGSRVEPVNGRSMSLTVSGTLTVESGAVLDVTGYGYEGGNDVHEDGLSPSWVSGSQQDEGGSHGGLGAGGYYQATLDPGEIFDSVYAPSLGGGGGGRSNANRWGGSGGGVVEVTAGSVILDGEIRARGEDTPGVYAGAGAGGTVVIDAGSLQGSGTIDASGGDYFVAILGYWGPPGGGGRVALYVDDLSQFDIGSQVSTKGGRRYSAAGNVEATAGAGSAYVLDSSSTFGDLLVHLSLPLGDVPPNTTLPTVGTGTVGLTEVDATDATDLWIEPQDPAALFSLGTAGMSVRIGGADYVVIDQTVDRRRLLLDGAAGLVSVGDAYEGVYKFDTVTVRGGAVLEFLDTADVTTFDVDADSQVITPQ